MSLYNLRIHLLAMLFAHLPGSLRNLNELITGAEGLRIEQHGVVADALACYSQQGCGIHVPYLYIAVIGSGSDTHTNRADGNGVNRATPRIDGRTNPVAGDGIRQDHCSVQ